MESVICISNLAEILLVSTNHISEMSSLKHGIQKKYFRGFFESRTLKSLGDKGRKLRERSNMKACEEKKISKAPLT